MKRLLARLVLQVVLILGFYISSTCEGMPTPELHDDGRFLK
ncbi:hypothetical protein [uncultured Draconibacterium sp.]